MRSLKPEVAPQDTAADTLEQRRQKAIAYLRERGIYVLDKSHTRERWQRMQDNAPPPTPPMAHLILRRVR